ncbi:MAG: ribosome silencing factor [Lachnospiraceae bacterium]|nr:ribosome silencing factor [Lachnospiraceae bacterium]
MNTKELAAKVFKALDDKKAEDVSVIDISEISVIADYFIVASANNQNHLMALQDAADEVMYKNGFHAKQVEGNRNSTWILLDYEDIIIHLFSAEDRLFYDLERIWKDGNFIEEEELMALLTDEK